MTPETPSSCAAQTATATLNPKLLANVGLCMPIGKAAVLSQPTDQVCFIPPLKSRCASQAATLASVELCSPIGKFSAQRVKALYEGTDTGPIPLSG